MPVSLWHSPDDAKATIGQQAVTNVSIAENGTGGSVRLNELITRE